MCKTVDSLYQKKHEEWFRNRLGNDKTLIVNFLNGSLQEAHLDALEIPYKQEGDLDQFASAFHWLMRTGLPRFSALNVIELSIRKPLIEWGCSIAYLLEQFGNIDYYLVHRFQ